MKLNKLKLRNFKGIRNFTLDTQGKDVEIFGDNGTGKTTLADAASWLLFNKDSQNKSDFEIKTLDANGEPLHGLDHEVEAVLAIDDRVLTLRKVYHENWTKKRGSADKEFSGHTTEHFVDGVPIKKTEYESRIAEIVDENAFKLLTNPRHFNEVLHWQERRQILLEVCGDVSDEDVIASDSKLAELPNILGSHKLEDYRKIIQVKRKEINDELERVPIRIDEAERNLPEAGDSVAIAASLSRLKEKRSKKSQALATLEAGGGVAEETKKLREVEVEMLKTQREHWTQTANETQSAKGELRKLEDEASTLEASIRTKQRLVADTKQILANSEKVMEQLRKEWEEVSAMEVTFEERDTCPTCGQALPAEQVQAAIATALANFNSGKAQQLEDISNRGKMVKSANTIEKDASEAAEEQIAGTEMHLAELNNKIADAQAVVESLEKQKKDYATAPAYIALVEKKVGIESVMRELKDGNSTETENIRQAIGIIDNEIGDCEASLAQIEQRKNGLKRIDELKAKERELATAYEKLEEELFLTEQFVRSKVKLLSEKVNSKFGVVRFKMFSELVNGGIEDCCLTLVDGVPYPNLNHGGEMAAGLDIISVLQQHYNFVAPVWIDNAEAFCHLPKMNCQMIKLIVSDNDPVLRVEKA